MNDKLNNSWIFLLLQSIRASGLVLLEAILCGALLLYFPVSLRHSLVCVCVCVCVCHVLIPSTCLLIILVPGSFELRTQIFSLTEGLTFSLTFSSRRHSFIWMSRDRMLQPSAHESDSFWVSRPRCDGTGRAPQGVSDWTQSWPTGRAHRRINAITFHLIVTLASSASAPW